MKDHHNKELLKKALKENFNNWFKHGCSDACKKTYLAIIFANFLLVILVFLFFLEFIFPDL